jgi:hypothetical protein
MSAVDYTPVLLAQLTDLSMRVTALEASNAALKAEVERLTTGTAPALALASAPATNRASNGVSLQTSIPLMPKQGSFAFAPAPASAPASASASSNGSLFHFGKTTNVKNVSAAMKPSDFGAFAQTHQTHQTHQTQNNFSLGAKPNTNNHDGSQKEYKPLTIQDVLHLHEIVTIRVNTGKDADGNFLQTTCVTVFDGVNLTVTECDLVPSLVGLSSSKPGQILYQFIEELKKSGHLKKPFTIAPWRLCFVERNGKRMNLEELRGTF